jgi:predicted DNA-binding transcriptional regulator YafY
VRRTVSPLGLVLKAGAWYLVAATDDEQPRTYRISKVSEVQTLEARCRRPRKFELARYWSQSIQRFESELYKSRAVVLATAAGLRGLRNLNSALSRAVAEVDAPPGKDGRVKVSIPIESIDHATGQLLRLSPEVQVVEPLALRQSLILRLRQTCRLYGLDSIGFTIRKRA